MAPTTLNSAIQGDVGTPDQTDQLVERIDQMVLNALVFCFGVFGVTFWTVPCVVSHSSSSPHN